MNRSHMVRSGCLERRLRSQPVAVDGCPFRRGKNWTELDLQTLSAVSELYVESKTFEGILIKKLPSPMLIK
jgi:hypothetical protein